MENTARKRRRVLSLQRIVKYSGPSPVREQFLLSVPRDIVRELGLSKGAKYHFHALGGVLTYEPMGPE